ncbi:phage repressor protein [Bradyrhizobium sp. PMVTL-01]|uniref:phage repressor protein n=1 Tax=Bradyrhizobium sp. PMVTL-01 TaxID=3434999 RepID=UPI003F702D2D
MLSMPHDGGIPTAMSTVVLPLVGDFLAGHTTGMADRTLKGILKRVERRLKTLGLSAQAASEAAGLSKDAIRNLRRAAEGDPNRKGISSRTAQGLAHALHTNLNWLVEGNGPEEPEEEAVDEGTVQLVGYVGAGAEAHFYAVAQGALDYVPAPSGSSPETKAVEIRGDSLGSFFDRWLVFYDDVRSPITDDLIGKLCVVGLKDDRVLIKKVRVGSKPRVFTLLSEREPPIEDVEIVWAAKVKTMVPR